MRLTLGSRAPGFEVHNPVWLPLRLSIGVGYVRVPMLRLDFLGRYDVADMLMLAASVVVVVAGFHLRLRHLRRCRHIVRVC